MSIYKYVKAKIANPHKVSHFGIEMLHDFEGFSEEAYPDPGSKDGKPWTIGFGTTRINGAPVREGMTISLGEAELAFEYDLERFEKAVRKAVKVPLTQHQFDALVSFTYNLGISAFLSSTLLRKLNRGDYMGAANEFPRWNKNDGKVMDGLTDRRNTERQHFLGDLV